MLNIEEAQSVTYHPGEDCPVCLVSFNSQKSQANREAKERYAIACGHVFCLECIYEIVNRHQEDSIAVSLLTQLQVFTCPACRTQYRSEEEMAIH